MRYDLKAGDYVSNIPYSLADRGTIWDTEDSTASTPESDRIEISNALDGDYRVEVIGQSAGEFWIGISDYDTGGGLTGWEAEGATSRGSRVVYAVHYTSIPGDSINVHQVSADSLHR